MLSVSVMQAAVSSVNLGSLHRAERLEEGPRALEIGDRQVHENHPGHGVFPPLQLDSLAFCRTEL